MRIKKKKQTKLQGDKSGERALYYKLPLIEVRLQFFVLSHSRFVLNHGLNVVTHVTIDFWFATRPNIEAISEGLRSQKISLKSRPCSRSKCHYSFGRGRRPRGPTFARGTIRSLFENQELARQRTAFDVATRPPCRNLFRDAHFEIIQFCLCRQSIQF
jgi:hypothetical protein